jgi:polar amino acid transport system substrate-binding protein
MRIANYVIIIILAFLAGISGAYVWTSSHGQQVEPRETAFDRVMRTQTLRCGYAVWSPVLTKDANTGKIGGIAYDIIEALGKKLNLKIDWAEEASWGSIVEGLATNRYDAICVNIMSNSARVRAMDFTTPVLFGVEYMLVRDDDRRFAHNNDLNSPNYTTAFLEGEAASFVAQQKYPQANFKSLPQGADYAVTFLELETKKVDAAIMELSTFREYEKSNPGKLKILDKLDPVLIARAGYGVPKGDIKLKTIMDVALEELEDDGTIDRAIRDHAAAGSFLTPIKPYQISN